MNIIISDKKQDYAEFMTEVLNTFQKHKINGIAVIALCDDENLTGYWNMSIYDKLTAENELRFDAIDEFIKVNRDRYLGDDENGFDIER